MLYVEEDLHCLCLGPHESPAVYPCCTLSLNLYGYKSACGRDLSRYQSFNVINIEVFKILGLTALIANLPILFIESCTTEQLYCRCYISRWHVHNFDANPMVSRQVNLLNSERSDDITILSTRSLTFLADVLPSSAASIVRNGAVPALCARLLAVEDIDLAEQSLQVRSLSLMFTKQTQASCVHHTLARHATLLVSAARTAFQPKL